MARNLLLASALLAVNALLWLGYLDIFRVTGGGADYRSFFVFAADAVTSGQNPYVYRIPEQFASFRWSPVAAWLFVPITALGWWAWVAAHFAALLAFRDWRVIAVVLISAPFLTDLGNGGVMIFVALAAWWAYRGSPWGIAAYLVLVLLIPRPLMVPLAVWILWKHPEWRIPFAVVFLCHAIAVVASGWHVEWIERLLTSGNDMTKPLNLSPSRWFGAAWLAIGIPLAAWLTLKGRIGWASLAISPYNLVSYLMMLVLEVTPPRAAAPAESASARPARHTSSGPDQRPSAP